MAHNKFLPRVLAAAAAMMLLAGCGSKADPGFSPANPVNITIWTYYNGEQLEAFNALVDEFNSTVGKEQGITVESSSHGSVTDLENNVLASAEGKVGAEAMPNIFSAYADTAYALDEMGQIADLSDYLSEEDRAAFIEDYLSEGDFSGSGSIKIFPVAKSAELLFLNETDWEPFAAATGATYDDLATIEGLVSVAERYYEWTDAQTPDIPNDGRAFFGRDAMANYMLIGAKQLGCTIFDANSSPSQRNSDLMLVRAPAQVVQSLYIATDTSWTPSINYGANGSSGFLYPVFQAAYHGNGELDAADYGHWTSSPYTLSGDDHSAIAYTIPLILDDGTVYGVLGVEILESYLQTLLPGTELQNDSSGTYLLGVASNSAIGKDDLTVSVISASPAANAPQQSYDQTLLLKPSKRGGYQSDSPLGLCHAAVAPLTLYNRNAPFSNEQMLLIGSVPVSALYAFSGYVLRFLIIAVLVVLTAGLFSSLVLARKLSRPISRLSDEVAHARESRSSIPMLSATGIIELDRFSSAFTQLGREVLDTSTKFLRIMDMASVELGGYELRSAPDSIYVTDNFFDLLGMPGVDADDLTAQSFRELLQRFERSCPHSPAPDGAMLYHIRLPSGKERYLRIETTHEDGTQVGLAEDATANTLEKLRIEHECDYDTLTDLYNRRAFHRICAEFFCSPEKLGHAALLMFDLDNLKQINDTFGHDWGDEYIRRTGECFAKNAPARTVCARISSDEFSALFYGYNDQDTLRADIRALKAALEHSVVQLPSGRELRVSVSGGIAWYPESSTDLITLRKYADFAMYQVKRSRKGELLEFDPEVYRTSLQERRCHEEFRRLINEELISYHFQPIIDAKDGSVFAYEALMRVDLPTLHSPADVLRLAREENCLHEVERITFFCASSAYQALENAGKVVPSALLFVNSIASQYLTPDELSEYSARYASILPRIVIEITEEECLDPKALRIKQTIRGSSGAFALDDYGSGYSNERSLLELSPNYIKIDLSIIRSIDTDANKRQIVSNTVSYAHQRGMKVVAEGLETADEVRTVLSLGVDLLHGFFLAMPQVEPGGASEESLAVIAEMHSQSDESQISIFGGDKQ